MSRHRTQGDKEEVSSKPTHHQHCLYLLAEMERVIDRSGTGWSSAEIAIVKARLLRIIASLA